MSATLVAIDVGASRTRVRFGRHPDAFERGGDPLIRDVRSAGELIYVLSQVRAQITGPGPVRLAAGLAAPPLGGGIREMTNWPTDRRISAQALGDIGFDEVILLNDLEVAAHGLVACLRPDSRVGELVPFGDAQVPAEGNRALVIPGSGLGSAGIIDLGPDATHRWHILASEAGHSLASGFEDEVLRRNLTALKGSPPTWEDCCSGPGLEALWVASELAHHDDPLSAPEIALRAASGDPRCQRALDDYYRFAARFSQVLALSYLATGGLYLAGGTTRSNAPLISERTFLDTFRDNEHMGPFLERVPVVLVLAEINLLGAWVVGWRGLEAG